MVHSSMLAVTDGEHLTCSGFSLGETVNFESLQFIIDCFDRLSLSPRGSNSGVVFIGMTHRGSSSLRTILEDSTDEFYMTSSRKGSSSNPISRRHSMGTLPAPITTTPWSEDAPTSQTITTIPSWTIISRPDTGLPPEQRHAFREGQRV
jgi:hypothetical protein